MSDQLLVFLSHTQGMRRHPEGESFLEGAERAVNAIDGAKAIHMEFFPASDTDPADTSVKHLRRADIFVAIIGFDYGTPLRDDPTRSFTELEFDTATQLGMERLVFLLRPEAAPLQQMHAGNVSAAQDGFRRKLEDSGATVAYFDSVGDLKFRITQALTQSIRERNQPSPPGPALDTGDVAKQARRAGCGAVTVMLTLFVLIGLLVWTAIVGAVPPWEGPTECTDITAKVIRVDPASFGDFQDGANLDIEIVNRRSDPVTVPAARNVIARGTGGRQYEQTDSFADQSWFFDVRVEKDSSAIVQLGLVGDGTDTVTVVIPDVRGTNPLLRCRLSVPAVEVAFAG